MDISFWVITYFVILILGISAIIAIKSLKEILKFLIDKDVAE